MRGRKLRVSSITTLTRLTTKIKTLDDLSYMQNVFSQLDDERQKPFLLVFDEVYVKSSWNDVI